METENIDELKDFIDDWNINFEKESAKHKSGLELSYIETNSDGSIKVEYNNIIEWQKNMLTSGSSIAEIDKSLPNLSKQFAAIYDKKIKPQTQNNMQMFRAKQNFSNNH